MVDEFTNIFKLEDVEFICNTMFDAFNIPISFLDKDGDILYEASNGYINNPVYPNRADLFRKLTQNDDIYNFPIFKTSNFYEDFFYISLKVNDTFKGTFFVGPSIATNVSLETIDTIITDLELDLSSKRHIFTYYNQLPIISSTKLVSYSLILYYSIYKIKLDPIIVGEKNNSMENNNPKISDYLETALSETRKHNTFHTPYTKEKYLIQCIKDGNKKNLIAHLNSPIGGEVGMLSKGSPLRNQKNIFLVICTLATRASIEGGLNSEIAYTLSDQYIQYMEELKDVQEVIDLSMKMVFDFTDRVYSVKELHKYSKLITKCQNYIFNHFYEDISLKQLSEIVNLNPNYLSDLFKKEVGITISEFIQKERVEEAKKLLVLTDNTLSEICTLLNFNAQSYFSTVFKKFTEATPKEYRKMNKITYESYD